MRQVAIAFALIGCATGSHTTSSSSPRNRAAIIVHQWPAPLRLPELPMRVHDDAERPILVIPRLGPPVEAPASPEERARLEHVATTSHGPARLAALDRLADALEADSEESLDGALQDERRDRALVAYRTIVSDPGFATYAKADAVLFRAGHLAVLSGRNDVAHEFLVELLAKHASSPLVADANVLLADAALDADPAIARRYLEDAIAVARGPLADYARLRHASALVNLGEIQAALVECEQIAANPTLREAASRLAVEGYSYSGDPAQARDFATRIDPDHVPELLRMLAHAYTRLGQTHDALIVLDDVVRHATDPEMLCRAYVDIYDAVLPTGHEMIAAARAIVDAAHVAPECRVEGDERLGALAYALQNEMWKYESVPPTVDEVWQLELAIVTTTQRRAAALRDRAYLRWEIAEKDRRLDAAAWAEAASALDAAFSATGDAELRDGAAAARANAAALRTSP